VSTYLEYVCRWLSENQPSKLDTVVRWEILLSFTGTHYTYLVLQAW